MSEQGGMGRFLLVWGGQFVSVLGSGLSSFGIVYWLFEKTGAATPFSIAALTATLPAILFAPLAGSLADRWNRKKLMLIADSCNAAVTLAILVLVATKRLEPWMIYVITFVSSSCGAFQGAAYQAAVPSLVPASQLARVNGLVSVSQATGSILPPVVAGALIGVMGLQGLLVIDACSYLFAVAGVLATRIPQPVAVESEGGGAKGGWRKAISDAAFGFRYLAARRPLLEITLYFAVVNFCVNFAAVLTGPLVIPIGGSAGFGIVQTALGLGALAGGLIVSAWGGPKRRRMAWVLGGLGASALGLAIAGLRATLGFVAAGLFVMMACIGVGGSVWSGIIQRKVEAGAMGRVSAARTILAQALMPIAFLLAGPLADGVFGPLFSRGGAAEGSCVGRIIGTGPTRGIGFMFIIAALLLILGSIAAAAGPHICRLDEEIPDAEEVTAGQGGDGRV